MKNDTISQFIKQEFLKWNIDFPKEIEVLNSGSGSNRQYFRIKTHKESYIATINNDIKENEAFFYLASFFRNHEVNVPKIEYISTNRTIYFQQDLGDINLLQRLHSEGLNDSTLHLYKQSLEMLWKMQYAGQSIDYSMAYPRHSFDKQSIMWDLNYFKYYFLKVSGLSFDEQLLEDDMIKLSEDLSVGDESYFMFRDFQARNIQIFEDNPWFIDFQGGRRGPLLYDVASLLYQASADLAKSDRDILLNHYYQVIITNIKYPEASFKEDFRMMAFVRIVQTLGAYGFRGLIEGKAYFKASIPNALINLNEILLELSAENKYSYFFSILHQLVEIKDKFVINNK